MNHHKYLRKFIHITVLFFISLFVTNSLLSKENINTNQLYSDLSFEVFRNGKPFGYHKITFDNEENGDLKVNIEVSFLYKLGFINIFKYFHTNEELWRNGRLVKLSTSTNDNKKFYKVTADGSGKGYTVTNNDETFFSPNGMVPTSYWNYNTLNKKIWLDTQRGILVDIEINPGPVESITISNNRKIKAQKFVVTGELSLSLWYSEIKELVRIKFIAKNSDIDYIRDFKN